MKLSAGLILYRWKNSRLEVLLGHMGGPFWGKRDEGAWSIPKGMVEKGEDLRQAALREFTEEIGMLPPGEPFEVGEIIQKSGKKVVAWALEGDFDPAGHKSNPFKMEWPPRSGRMVEFPEMDKVEWMTVEKACAKAIEGQADLFRQLEEKLKEQGRHQGSS
jgi:predicted NUDIX family NTP pyrophosphohydrolase